MAYKISGTELIKDDQTVTFNNITATQRAATFAGIGALASKGYTMGGITSPSSTRNTIDSFPFASDTNASDVGDTTSIVHFQSGQSSPSHGYSSGGSTGTPSFQIMSNIIQRIPFSENANATDVGDLTVSRRGVAGNSSGSNGYATSGYIDPSEAYQNVIDKFPFASATTNASDVGDLTQERSFSTGTSGETHGYTAGGYAPGGNSNVIDKFPFSSDGNATDVGDLTQARYLLAGGQSSGTHGYSSGGYIVPDVNVIDKFPFSADANATDVGDLTQARYGGSGQQG